MGAPADLRGWLTAFVHDAHFLARYPYHAHVLAALAPVADPSVPLMGVSLHAVPGSAARYYLHVHIEEVARVPQFLRGILLHEVHHIVLGHLAHPKFFGAEQRDLMQIAQETSANEHIDEPLPSPVLWQHFERYGLRAGQSTLQRYQLLCDARSEGAQPALARDTQMVDEHAWVSAPQPPPGGLTETRQLLEQVAEAGGDASKVEAEQGTLAGHTPAQLIAQLGGSSGPREVLIDWRDALRAFVAEARAPQHTWARPSRRFPSRVGQVPGRAYRVRPVLRPRLVIAIDTSLSMTEAELNEIARQLRPLGELAQLHVVECDRSIARSYAFEGTLQQVKGRGGTDLRPVFEPAFLCARGAEGVIYFTDGDGPYPDHPPPIPVLWMLTKPREFACPWGARAALTMKSRLAASERARR